MNKEDKDWARNKIFQIIDTPTAELLADDPRDKLVSNHVRKTPNLGHSRVGLKREKYSHEEQQMQLFAKYLAEALRKQNDQK
jgi:hypothetical protein